ncbi:hypothetical protein Y032_0316g2279 [Ancylostoma ceylanicum]|nr:hypothetical protein Y032_0316g2279 [Ancylostoma ceylanicum]
MFQLFRGLAFMSSLNICHRDIKPHNLLVNPEKGTLRICDFGSAKVMNKDDTNVSYICSRYYRAPELIFGAVSYTTKIDVWSAGTVMAELLLGKPLFPGESAVDQLVEIMKVLGSPTKEEIFAMNQNYKEFKFPNVKRIPWEKLFKGKSLQSAVSMLSTVLRYDPSARSYAIETLAHPFFDELRNPDLEILYEDRSTRYEILNEKNAQPSRRRKRVRLSCDCDAASPYSPSYRRTRVNRAHPL